MHRATAPASPAPPARRPVPLCPLVGRGFQRLQRIPVWMRRDSRLLPADRYRLRAAERADRGNASRHAKNSTAFFPSCLIPAAYLRQIWVQPELAWSDGGADRAAPSATQSLRSLTCARRFAGVRLWRLLLPPVWGSGQNAASASSSRQGIRGVQCTIAVELQASPNLPISQIRGKAMSG
jgi:hypothetical protein